MIGRMWSGLAFSLIIAGVIVFVRSAEISKVKLTGKTHPQSQRHVDRESDDEDQEEGMVLATHTVVDPLAVVVEPVDTLVADIAVP